MARFGVTVVVGLSLVACSKPPRVEAPTGVTFTAGQVRFSNSGISIETVSLGAASRAELDAEGRLQVQRAGAIEQLTTTPEGLEHAYRFETRPAGDGDLEVRLRVHGARSVGTADGAHRFRANASSAELTYGEATWVDARGKRTPMQVRADSSADLLLVVDAATVASSAWPAVIDPIVSVRFGLNTMVPGQTDWRADDADVAFDGTNYLVIWVDNRDIGSPLFGVDGARVSPDGTVLDTAGFRILDTSTASRPSVSFDGTNFVVTAYSQNGYIYGNRVSRGGQVLGSLNGAIIAHGTLNQTPLDLASSDAGISLVTWTDYPLGDVQAQVFNGALAPIGSTLALTSNFNNGPPRVAFNGESFLVAWSTRNGVLARRVTPQGQRVGAPALTVGPGPRTDQHEVDVASAGPSWLVSWDGPNGVSAARLDADGGLLDATPMLLSANAPATNLRVSQTGPAYQVSWFTASSVNGRYDLWVNRVPSSGAQQDGLGALVQASLGVVPNGGAGCSGDGCLVTLESSRGFTLKALRIKDTTPLAPLVFVDEAKSRQNWPSIARGPNAYLVTWFDYRSSDYAQLWATRVDLNGTVLDPDGIELCGSAGQHGVPRIAATTAGDFFVVWDEGEDGSSGYSDLRGTRVLANGHVVTPCGAPMTSSRHARTPSIASDGTGYLLAWYEDYGVWPANALIQAARLDATGAMLDAPPLTLISGASDVVTAVAYGKGVYFVVFQVDSKARGIRVPVSGPPLDVYPGVSGGSSYADFPSVSFNGEQFVVAYRVYDPTGNPNDPWFHMYAARVATDGGLLDPAGVRLSKTQVYGYTSAGYRMAPEQGFDGVDTVFTWSTNDRGFEVFTAWLSPDGGAFGTNVTSKVAKSIPWSPTIAGRGDGDHSLLVYAGGDQSPGVRSLRIQGQIVTFRVTGHGCSVDAECKSGFCVDAVCCESGCGGGSTSDCQACSVAAGAAVDGHCGAANAGVVCRPSTGVCDVADSCDGVNLGCGDAVASSTTVCRPSVGLCDAEETCTGSSPSCPGDRVASSSVVCRDASGLCDKAEKCTGASAVCPADLAADKGTLCRAASGVCDVAETCTGASTSCPSDAFATGSVCRPASGACDVAETCAGDSAGCPPDGFAVGAVCRAASGACDVAETCTGSAATCPANSWLDAGVSCRAPAGACDVGEVCTGTSGACPSDVVLAEGTVCRASLGACDQTEHCSGHGAACPVDRLEPSTTVCRAANGACDVAERCSGLEVACPGDAYASGSTVCRAPKNDCDAAERCTGSAPGCPSDAFAPNGAVCGATASCLGNQSCRSGVCTSGVAPNCDDGDVCTTDGCSDGSGCTHVKVPGCCSAASDCDDHDACTTEACAEHRCVSTKLNCDDGDGCTKDVCTAGVCGHDAIATCGPVTPVAGCGCSSGGIEAGLVFAVLGLLGRRRRRL